MTLKVKMKFFVGITDNEWFEMLSNLPDVDEVNFWQPSGKTTFRALQPGEPFLFKLHSPRDYIVGGGFFAHSTIFPLSLAWDAFREKNGADSLEDMRSRIKEEFENGKYYYTFHGKEIHPPDTPADCPSKEFLIWHNDKVFRG